MCFLGGLKDFQWLEVTTKMVNCWNTLPGSLIANASENRPKGSPKRKPDHLNQLWMFKGELVVLETVFGGFTVIVGV